MSGWPWPLNGVQSFFENLWSWIGRAAVQAVSVVSTWINSAVASIGSMISGGLAGIRACVTSGLGGLWSNFVSWGSGLWNSIASGLNNVGTWIQNSFNTVVDRIRSGLSGLWGQITGAWSNFTNWISQGINSLGSSISSGLTNLGAMIQGTANNIVRNTEFWANSIALGVNNNAGQILTAIDNAVGTIGGWVSEALKGVTAALGEGLKGFWDWFVKGLGALGTTIGGFFSGDILSRLGDALRGLVGWIASSVAGLFQRVLAFFASPHSPDPQNPIGSIAEILTMVLGFTASISVPLIAGELVHPLKEMGLGQVSAMLYDMAGFGRIASALTLELATISYITPLRYMLNQLWRPSLPRTGVADQMLFEGHIDEPRWTEIYQKWGWKDADIDAWRKTMWREPNQRTLVTMLSDPDVDEEWIRLKLKENGFIGEDADALIAYGKRQTLKDERTALATQIQNDYLDGVINDSEMAGDLSALKFTVEEIAYRVARAQMIKARNIRRAVLKEQQEEAKRAENAAKEADREAKKAEAAAKAKTKKLSESDLAEEVKLGLRGPEQYIADLVGLGYPGDLARRKYAIESTPKPLTPAELERRRRVVEARISRARRRYEGLIAGVKSQIDLAASQLEDAETVAKETLDVIDAQLEAYELEMPTATPARAAALERLRTVQLQRRELQEARSAATIRKLTEQRTDLEESLAMTERERDGEMAELEAELTLVGAG